MQECRCGVESMKKILVLFAVGCFGTTAVDPSVVQEELMANVASIRQAQLDLLVLGDFTPCGDETSAIAAASTIARDWEGGKCWSDVGWAPPNPVHGGYWVAVQNGDFTVTGVGPLINGQRLTVTATKSKTAAVQ